MTERTHIDLELSSEEAMEEFKEKANRFALKLRETMEECGIDMWALSCVSTIEGKQRAHMSFGGGSVVDYVDLFFNYYERLLDMVSTEASSESIADETKRRIIDTIVEIYAERELKDEATH